jgi:hypothetical protein
VGYGMDNAVSIVISECGLLMDNAFSIVISECMLWIMGYG